MKRTKQEHAEARCRSDLNMARRLETQGEQRAAAFYRDCAKQWAVWARYFRRYPNSKRAPIVG